MAELNLLLRVGGDVAIDGRDHTFRRLLTDGRFAFEDAENGRPRVMREDEFVSLYVANRVFVKAWSRLPIDEHPIAERSLDALPVKALCDAEWRHAYCTAFDKRHGLAKNEKCLTALIEDVFTELKHEKKPHWKTLLTWLRTRGAPGRRPLRSMRSYTEKRGRKKGVDDAVEDIIEDAIKDVFMNRALLPPTAVFEVASGRTERRNRDLIAASDPNKPVPDGLLLSPPSLSTVYRRIRDHDYYRTMRVRIGWRAANLQLEPLRAAPQSTFPLERIQIDHTKLDGWMFFDETSALPCGGRPWLTMAIDTYSRYPLGFYIGFEPPSVYSVMMCLRQAIAPKADYLRRFPTLKSEWLALGNPWTLIADNGKEFVGLSLPRACAELGIELETSPVKTPKHKGIVERFFGTLNKRFMHRLPGTTYGSPQTLKELEIDPKKTMRISFQHFQYLFVKWLLEDYCKSKNRMMGTTPEKRWIEGTKAHRLELPERMSVLKVVLARHGEAMLTRNGVRFQNLTFRNPKTVSAVLASANASKEKVEFRFDPMNVSEIFVLNKITGEYLPLESDEAYSKNLSLWQLRIIQQENRRRERSPKSFADLMLTRTELIEETLEAIRAGKAKTSDARFRRLGETGVVLVTPRPGIGRPRNGSIATSLMTEGVARHEGDLDRPVMSAARQRKNKAAPEKIDNLDVNSSSRSPANDSQPITFSSDENDLEMLMSMNEFECAQAERIK